MTQTVLLGDIADINSESVGKNYPFNSIMYLDTSSVTENTFSKLQPFDIVDAPSRARRIVKNGDIVYSTVRPNLKHFGYIKSPAENTVASTGFAVIRSRKHVDSKYLYYWLASDEQTEYLTAIADSQTSTFPAFNPSVLGKLKINLPDHPTQKKIANILGTIDEKIELNRQMNETLEQMGQALFRHHFIDNPEAEKWNMSTVGEFYDILLGGTPSRTKSEYWKNGTIGWINSGKINEFRITKPSELITKEALDKSAAKLLPVSTTVIAITGATLGQISRLEREFAANQSVIGMVPKTQMGNDFIYYWIKSNIVKLIGHQTGGAQQHINRNNVVNFEIPVVDDETLKRFRENINPISDQISNNCFEIQTLTTLRDTLLPQLISGKMKV